MVFGFSGSGKSTISKRISEEYSLPILYIDQTLYYENWVKKSKETTYKEIKEFIEKEQNWIIDGNATNNLFEQRAALADKIIFMNFSRFQCYKNALNRYNSHKEKDRESRPFGCKEKFDLSFQFWILFKGRIGKRIKKFKNITQKYQQKCIILKNKKDVEFFYKNMDILLLK